MANLTDDTYFYTNGMQCETRGIVESMSKECQKSDSVTTVVTTSRQQPETNWVCGLFIFQ